MQTAKGNQHGAIQLLTAKETARVLNVAVQTLAVWRCKGMLNLPYVKLGSRAVRYRVEDVERFVEQQLSSKARAA